MASPDAGADEARGPDREPPRKPPSGGPRRPPGAPTPDDLTIMLRRFRQRVLSEIAALRASGAAMRVAAVAAGAGLALWVGSGFYVVRPGQTGVVTTFGAYSRTASVGPNYHLPVPFEQAQLVSTSALEAMDIGAGGGGGDVDPNSLMLTSDGDIVSVNFTVQYRVTDPRKYLFDIKDPHETIRAAAESAIRAAVGKVAYPQVLSGGHAAIQGETRTLIQATLDRYGAGVSVVDVQIVAAGPPREVAPDSQAVAAARQAAQGALNEARIYAAKAVSDAHAAATKLAIEAQAYHELTIHEAQGETSQFSQLDEEYRRAPAVTKQRMYTETMERILARSNKVIVDGHGASTPLVLPPEAFRARGPTVDATTTGAGR